MDGCLKNRFELQGEGMDSPSNLSRRAVDSKFHIDLCKIILHGVDDG